MGDDVETMYSDNHGYMRQKAYGRGSPQERGDTRGCYQPGYAKWVCPLVEYVDNEDYLRYDDYVEYDDRGGWHGGRARNGYLSLMSRGYDGIGDFGQGSSHLMEDRRWVRHEHYDSSYNDNPASYEMQHQVRKRALVQVPQRKGKCFGRKGDAPRSAYKKWKEPTESTKLTGSKAGVKEKGSKEFQTCGITSANELVEEDEVCVFVLIVWYHVLVFFIS